MNLISQDTFVSNNVFLLLNNEEYIKEANQNILLDYYLDVNYKDFNFVQIDAKNDDIKSLLSVINNYPVMSEYYVVYLRDFDISKITKDQQEIFKTAFLQISPSTIIIISTIFSDTPYIKNEKVKNFSKLLAKNNGLVINCCIPADEELSKFIKEEFKKQDITISFAQINMIINKTNRVLFVINSEIEKITYYLKSINLNKVTENIVSLLVTENSESKLYQLAGHIISKNFSKSIDCLDELLCSKIDPIVILATICNSYIELYRAKLITMYSVPINEAAKMLGYRYDFILKNAITNCKKIPLDKLGDIINLLSETDIKFKSQKIDTVIELETLIAKLIFDFV